MAYRHTEELRAEWRQRREEIELRLGDFQRTREGRGERLFEELAFCLLAIQTSAHRSDDAVRHLARSGLLWRGTERGIAAFLRRRVRFHRHKARYLVAARNRFLETRDFLRTQLDNLPSPLDLREWLVREVYGLGYKEASHFLRNVGRGEDLAILDRHVLRNLRYHGVIREVPKSLSRRQYLTIEEKVRAFSAAVGIPMAALDLVLWSRETGEVFK